MWLMLVGYCVKLFAHEDNTTETIIVGPKKMPSFYEPVRKDVQFCN